MLNQLRRDLQAGVEKAGCTPKVLVMGALVKLNVITNEARKANITVGSLW
jgi:hypothetical protein